MKNIVIENTVFFIKMNNKKPPHGIEDRKFRFFIRIIA